MRDLVGGEMFDLRSTVTSPEARLDIKAGRFWTHVNSTCNHNAGHKYLGHLSKKYEIQESNHFNQSPYCNSVK